MSDETEIFICKHCGKEHEALTQEVASYICPKLRKQKEKVKVLDQVSLKYLTEINSSSETQEPQTSDKLEPDNGEPHEKDQ